MGKTKILIFSILLALDLVIAGSLWIGDAFGSGKLELHVLDVGQGDAVLLRTPEMHNVLIDGGPGNEVLMGMAASMPYLFSEIDLLVLTHPHADHIEGLIPVLDRFEVGAVMLSAPEYGNLAYKHFLDEIAAGSANGDFQVFFADDGTDFRLGSVTLDVLYPFEPIVGEEMENVNNASPVILVHCETCGGGSDGASVLLAGDAEREIEAALLEAGALDGVDVDVFKSSHHGSRTANSLEFLEAIAPEMMVISLGEGNSFDHPHDETLENAEELGIEIRRTDLEGQVTIEF